MKVHEVKMVPMGKIKPAEWNPREMPEDHAKALSESLSRWGLVESMQVDTDMVLIGGHQRYEQLRASGYDGEVPVAVLDLSDADKKALNIALNSPRLSGEYTADAIELLEEVRIEIPEAFEAIDLEGLSEDLKQSLEGLDAIAEGNTDPDEVPDEPEDPVTRPGDLWLLGDHRLLCGDSTKAEDVARLMNGAKAILIHADPPYGMGKEKDGVANDNLYREKLDAFQMDWWRAFRPHVEDNASAYIWGNAEDLWRLWYVGGLKDSERLTMRNEIVWDKGSFGYGQATEAGRMFATYNERCLFFMLGEQGFNNNADNYWEGWEPIRAYLEQEMRKCEWTTADLNRITGTQMAGHWVTKSQWGLITEAHYEKIRAAAREHDAFKREHDDLKREHDDLKREHDDLKREFYATRAPFDNTHDNMTDVWDFARVTGEDRHGHATPKPVDMVARAVKSSAPKGEIVIVPFGGSGPDFIACELHDRKAYGMELEPKYCDVILQRWADFTGNDPKREDGASFAELSA